MSRLPRSILIVTIIMAVAGVTCPAWAADIAERDVLLNVEMEGWGAVRGMQPVAYEQANRGIAMSMSADALAVGALNLQPGDYTLVLWQMAPNGSADGFFVEIGNARTRLLGTIGRWGTLTHPFEVKAAGPITIAIIGQEPTMTIDRIAVVRGSYDADEIAFSDIPGETTGESLGLDQITRLSMPCTLAEIPEAPAAPGEQTLYHEDFEAQAEGVSGEHQWVEGPFGQAVVLDMPDGRLDIDAADLAIGEVGTVEWWVKPREAARVWWDQGWHFFLHAEPAQPGGTQLDLFGLLSQLQLHMTRDGKPYTLAEGDDEMLTFSTSGLDITQWHHVLVSWDLRGDRQYLWAMVDGVGMQSFFPRTFDPGGFSRVEIGNTPSDWDVPYLPMDGAVDAIRISNVSVAERLED